MRPRPVFLTLAPATATASGSLRLTTPALLVLSALRGGPVSPQAASRVTGGGSVSVRGYATHPLRELSGREESAIWAVSGSVSFIANAQYGVSPVESSLLGFFSYFALSKLWRYVPKR